MTMAVTNAFYIFVGEGDYMLCIAVSGLNGVPFGAKFLADAILADIIDYDEFLTGQRSVSCGTFQKYMSSTYYNQLLQSIILTLSTCFFFLFFFVFFFFPNTAGSNIYNV